MRTGSGIDLKCRVRDLYKMFRLVEKYIQSSSPSAQRDQLIRRLILGESTDAKDYYWILKGIEFPGSNLE